LNPVKIIEPKWREIGPLDIAGIREHLGKYEYSSYLDYVAGERAQAKILNINAFPDYFLNAKEHRDFVDFWITQEDKFEQKGEVSCQLST
jgi:hypothetical protein